VATVTVTTNRNNKTANRQSPNPPPTSSRSTVGLSRAIVNCVDGVSITVRDGRTIRSPAMIRGGHAKQYEGLLPEKIEQALQDVHGVMVPSPSR